ncbi:MAG: alpha-ketoacid dehydrogenase subunit beta [Nitrospinota bacterium]
MREITFADALNEALREEMRRDPLVFCLGEDVAAFDGAFGVTRGLFAEFGPGRVMDTPISENSFVGAAIGAAIAGTRPVAELQFLDFVTLAMDQIVNLGAKIRYMSGGQVKVPAVIRAPYGTQFPNGATHVQSLEAWFQHVPGVKVAMPSGPRDAKGLLKSAVRDDNLVLFLENKGLYSVKGEVPEGEYTVPLGEAAVRRRGRDLTVVALGAMVPQALTAAERIAEEGIEAEVIDLRTVTPLDRETVLASVRKTGRAAVVHEAVRIGGVGAEIGMMIQEEAFDYLDAPVKRIAAAPVPFPFSPALKRRVVPDLNAVVEGLKSLAG